VKRISELAIMAICFIFTLSPALLAQANNVPVVTNVSAQQRPGTRLIDISYDVVDADGDLLEITVLVSNDGGATYGIVPVFLAGDVGSGISPGTGKHIVWDVEMDRGHIKGENFKVRVIADDRVLPATIIGNDGAKMVLIPAGEFEMGDSFNEGQDNELPVHTVYLDAFYIDVYKVTNAQYAQFLNSYGKNTDDSDNKLLALDSDSCLVEKSGNTYSAKSGYGDHPVIEVSWYGAKAYAESYGKRLPTEAEWEKAARGGLVGKRYPWGDNIDSTKADYDVDNTWGDTATDMLKYLEQVGSFAPNSYGLYDMAGNVWDWCADWYGSDYYSSSPENNPRGPGSGNWRVMRGGSWCYYEGHLRCADRHYNSPALTFLTVGFRCCASLSD
jgi:formylglycine-generating enzyme